jgi:hypothetical protein
MTRGRLGGRLDAMIDRILQQRLQHERRHLGVLRAGLDVPRHLQALAQAQALQLEILPAQGELLAERHQSRLVLPHQHAEQIGQLLQRLLRPGADPSG